MQTGILNGLRVLDFTRVLAGPFATRILADFGAEVIKVQSRKTATGAESNTRAYFQAWNRNKRSISLDMDYPEAREIALRLTQLSDVVVENFSPRVMTNWQLAYTDLRKARSDIIVLSMSAAGQTGPWRDRVAYGPTVQSASGLTYLTSFSKDDPQGLGTSYADLVAGLYGALAVLSALEYRQRTGKGAHIDLSQYEAVCTMIAPALMESQTNQTEVLPLGNHAGYVEAAPHGCYRCLGEDRWCVIAVFDEAQWQGLCNSVGVPGLAGEVRFSSLSKRKRHEEELNRLLEAWTSERKAEEVMRILQDAGVPAGVVQTAEELARDPQLLARDFFMCLEHPVLGSLLTDTCPMRFTGKLHIDRNPAPLFGQDNRYVFRELLGFTEEAFRSHVKRGIIG
jgi:crotonobetainyl-CoA:carnitine CoA-transferase CaiB-like acyl-CoA transferase